MKLKIAAKIGLGFGLVTIAVLINGLLMIKSLNKSRDVNEKMMNINTPSIQLINELYSQISDSRMLIKSWVHIDKISDTPDKLRLKELHAIRFPGLIDSLMVLSKAWESQADKDLLKVIHTTVSDTLFPKHQYIMNQLSTFESYDDPFLVFEVTPMTEEGGDVMILTQKILDEISTLQQAQQEKNTEGSEAMIATFDKFYRIIFIMLLVLIFASLAIAFFTIRSLVVPIANTKNILLSMSKGILPEEKLEEGTDEVGQMAKALNMVVGGLQDVTNFTSEIGKGNFDTEFKPLSDEDTLGLSILEMREELINARKEEEKREEENKQRNWASQGVALFSDVLRQNNDNLEKLSYEIISNMVQYTNSNQGGIFIVNDNDKENIFLEMSACYAYDRQKFITKTIQVGEGLVGRCYQEQEKIFLTEIPKDYIKIASGLGEESPTCLLIIPLAYNDIIFGIMEIASFKVYEDFEVEFMERIGESIAATISSVKSNVQTAMLLEQSQQQAEEMSAQEEEMRQNMEELRATQEQSARREEELVKEVENLKRQLKEVNN